MEELLERAINLREQGRYEEANSIFIDLANDFPENPLIHYHCAWSFDLLGQEAQAVPHYEAAIRLGLSGKELKAAYLGLGSTFRTLGEYEKSRAVFLDGINRFPENRALQPFYAMTLYNLREHQQAMEILLKCLVETTNNEAISSYKKAIEFYWDKLDEVWK